MRGVEGGVGRGWGCAWEVRVGWARGMGAWDVCVYGVLTSSSRATGHGVSARCSTIGRGNALASSHDDPGKAWRSSPCREIPKAFPRGEAHTGSCHQTPSWVRGRLARRGLARTSRKRQGDAFRPVFCLASFPLVDGGLDHSCTNTRPWEFCRPSKHGHPEG